MDICDFWIPHSSFLCLSLDATFRERILVCTECDGDSSTVHRGTMNSIIVEPASLFISMPTNAAPCMQFSLLGATFAPEFTHQIFPVESTGTQLPLDTGSAASNDDPVHPLRLDPAGLPPQEISIRIELDPSCASCSLSVEGVPKKRQLSQLDSISLPIKRVKQDDTGIDTAQNGDLSSMPPCLGNSAISIEAPTSSEQSIVLNWNDTKKEEIRNHLQSFLPPLRKATHLNEDTKGGLYCNCPYGTVVSEYTRRGHDFCLSLCQGSECVDYHNAVQKLALYFIESADDVDVSDSAWTVLYLFRKHAVDQFSLAGFMTLFAFNSPFRKPMGGIILRVCQALILPPYQRSGHGTAMLNTVFDISCGKVRPSNFTEDVVEVNVEDPAPAFELLRIVVDYDRFRKSQCSWFSKEKQDEDSDHQSVDDEKFFVALSEGEALRVVAVAKTTVKQIHLVYELHKLERLQESTTTTTSCEILDKRFRLMVKFRLNRENREELSGCTSKSDAKLLLGSLFDKLYCLYQTILRHAPTMNGKGTV